MVGPSRAADGGRVSSNIDLELRDTLQESRARNNRDNMEPATKRRIDDLFETLGQIREMLTEAQAACADIEDTPLSQLLERMRVANIAAGNRAAQIKHGYKRREP